MGPSHDSKVGLSSPSLADKRAHRVLIVDDDPDHRHLVGRVLEQHWVVEEINHGLKALNLIRENPPDAVIADVVMPAISGFEFCRELRSDEKTRNIPVILLSGLDDADAQEQGREAGANEYLIKPVDTKELVVRLKSLLEKAP